MWFALLNVPLSVLSLEPEMIFKSCVLVGAALALVQPSRLAAQSPFKPAELIGTWQLMARTNTRTGAVDSVANHRLAWEGFTQNTYHVFEMDLNPTPSKEELRSLPKLDRQKRFLEAANYVGRGGMYTVDREKLHFRRVMSGDPNDIGTTPTAIVDSIKGNWMYRRTVPDSTGLVTLQLYKRVQ